LPFQKRHAPDEEEANGRRKVDREAVPKAVAGIPEAQERCTDIREHTEAIGNNVTLSIIIEFLLDFITLTMIIACIIGIIVVIKGYFKKKVK
jgi:hypothetical protein